MPPVADTVVPVRLPEAQVRYLDRLLDVLAGDIRRITGRNPSRSGALRLVLQDYARRNPLPVEVTPQEVEAELEELCSDGNPFL